MRVIWTAKALADLREIVAYIQTDNPSAARRIRLQIRNATRRLARFPLSGRTVPEYPAAALREIIVRDYRVIYEPAEGQVEILAVVHGKRDLRSLPPFG